MAEIPEKKEESAPAPEPVSQIELAPMEKPREEPGRDAFYRKLIPPAVATVGRSAKLRDTFTLSGVIYVEPDVVTITPGGTETELVSFEFQPNELHVGMVVRVTASGVFSSSAAGLPQLYGGRTVGSNWSTIRDLSGLVADAPWSIVWTVIIRSIGTSATAESQMLGAMNNVVLQDSNTSTVSFDTTVAVPFMLWVDYNSGSGASFTCRQFIVECLY